MGDNTYQSSLLGKTIASVLNDIKTIKATYPRQTAESMETRHARKIITLFQTILNDMHKSVLPRFDEQKIPNALGMIAIASKIHSLSQIKSVTQSRKYLLLQSAQTLIKETLKQRTTSSSSSVSSITSTLIHELQTQKDRIFARAKKVPGPDLDSLLPRLIQEVSSLELDNQSNLGDSDVVDGLLKKLMDGFFDCGDGHPNTHEIRITHPMTFELLNSLIQHLGRLPQELEHVIPFFNPDALTNLASSSQTINFQDFYNRLPQDILEQIEVWFNECPDAEEVIYQKKHACVLKAFHEAELEDVGNRLGNHMTAIEQYPYLFTTDTGAYVQNLQTELVRRQKLAQENHELQLLFEKKHEDYQTQQVRNLLSCYPGMSEGMEADYGQFPLPDVIFIEHIGSSHLSLLRLKTSLEQYLHASQQSLTELAQRNRNELKVLEESLKMATGQWVDEVKLERQATIQNLLKTLDIQQAQMSNIDQNRVKIVRSQEKAIDVISAQLHELDDLIKNVVHITSAVNDLARLAEQQQLPEALSTLDLKNTLSIELTPYTHPLNNSIGLVLQQCDSSHKALLRTRELWQNRLQKAESDARFYHNMQSAAPEKLDELQREQEAHLNDLRAERDALTAELPLINGKIELQQTVLNELTATESNLTERLCVQESQISSLQEEIMGARAALATQLSTTMDNLEQTLKDSLDSLPECPDDMIRLLTMVLDMLQDETRIPFRDINTFLKEHSQEQACTHFDGFVSFISSGITGSQQAACSSSSSSSSETTSIDWKTFRSRQDSRVRIRPSKEEYQQAHSLLRSLISRKQGELEQQLDLKQKKISLDDLTQRLADAQAAAEGIRNDQLCNKKQSSSAVETYIELLSHFKEMKRRKKIIPTETGETEGNIKGLTLLRALLNNTETLRNEVTKNADSEQHFLNDPALPDTFRSFSEGIEALSTQLQSLTKHVSSLTHVTVWEQRLATIPPLFSDIKDQIAQQLESKIHASNAYIHNELTALESSLNAIANALARTDAPSLLMINQWLSEVQPIPAALQQQSTLIHTLSSALGRLQVSTHDSALDHMKHREQQLQALSLDLSTQIMAKRDQAIQQLNNACLLLENQLNGLIHEETVIAQDLVGTTLNAIHSATQAFSPEDHLDLFSNELTEATRARQQAIQVRLTQEQGIHEATLLRIQARQVCVQTFRQALEAYQTTRHMNYRYKDSLFSSDRTHRERFLAALINDMNEYALSGNNQAVMTRIATGLRQFPGVNLSSLLNELASSIYDIDRYIPADYRANIPTEPDPADLTYSLQRLIFEPDTHHYALEQIQSILALHTQINVLRVFSMELEENDPITDAVTNLVEQLQGDLARFVLKHRYELPTEGELERFKTQFTQRIHSKDALLHENNTKLGMIIGNLLAGIFSLGLALLGRAVYSKISYGHVRLFFDKSDGQQHLEQIEERLNNLHSAPAA